MQINPKAEKILEDGWYAAEIGDTEDKDTKFGERLMVPFSVEAGGDTVEITAFISYSDHPKSNVVKWGKSLFGDRPFDTDEFSGVSCEVFVEEGEDQDGAPKNFIRKVRPIKTKGAKAGKAKQDVDEPDFSDIPV